MKKVTKFFLPLIILALVILLTLVLAFLKGYQNIDMVETHKRVQPSEFNRRFQPAELKADLDFLMKTLEEVHPDLYAYTPKSIITQESIRIEGEIDSPMTRLNFYLKIAPLVAKLNDGHTKIYPPYEEYYDYLGKGGSLFPFDLEFRDGRVYIKVNYSSDTLAEKDSELLAINGIPIIQIVDTLLEFISSERKIHKLESLEDSFQHMLWLVYNFKDDFEVEFMSSLDGKRHTRKITEVTYNVIKGKKKDGSTEEVYYSYHSLPDEKIGIIELRKFIDQGKFEKFLQDTFTQIKKEGIADLIIDIRENPGGYSDLAEVLLGYITDKPVTKNLNMEIKVSKQIKDWYRSTLRWYVKWLPFQYIHSTWRKIWSTPEGEKVLLRSQPEKPKENPLRFNGRIYLIIGPRTFSTATGFAAAVKDYRLGILVGEETGGLATSFGDYYPFDLPNTRLWVFVSHKRIFRPSGEDDGRGVLPDYEVKRSSEDLEKGFDKAMEFTKELIKSNKFGKDIEENELGYYSQVCSDDYSEN
jgi:C-terminal processing protease CtpA/Prc